MGRSGVGFMGLGLSWAGDVALIVWVRRPHQGVSAHSLVSVPLTDAFQQVTLLKCSFPEYLDALNNPSLAEETQLFHGLATCSYRIMSSLLHLRKEVSFPSLRIGVLRRALRIEFPRSSWKSED